MNRPGLHGRHWHWTCTAPGAHWGPRMSIVNAWRGALGGSFFYHFFTSILDSILDSSWVRFGLVLGAFGGPFGSPNPIKLGQKCVLNCNCVKNYDFHTDLRFPKFWAPSDPKMGPKIASRPVQDGSKSDKKVMHFSF